ncbi:Integrator complex subunit 1 [Trichinella pseudospiralis]|uniref:Integrator complex subunit 1 n=1 Tax=Trichinella pseudospiralis TaxID=6337 RepID=A0A0V1J4P0_TRIPS|nr:Integrator complex subunit 1 [Trichinella pseudospiralis]
MERKNYLSRYNKGYSKQKANQPSGNFIALGNANVVLAVFLNLVLGSRAQLPTTSSLEKRRCSLASPAVTSKTRFTDQSPSVTDKSSLAEFSRNLNKGEFWHESITPLDAYDKLLNSKVMKVDDMARLLLSLVKGLCAKFEKFPDPMSSLLLVYIAKHQPEAYTDVNVIEALCTLIVKVPQQRSLWQAWSNLFCVICESLMIALDDKTDWPECIAKAFIQDSLGERLWVDRKECNAFVKNIMTVFNTVLPAYDAIDTLVSECVQSGGMAKCVSPTYSLIIETEPLVNDFSPKHKVCPRFVRISDSFCLHTAELLREFVSRRLDPVPRNLLLTLASCCGHEEIRQMASQKLDGWLQTSKMTKPLAILLLSTCVNCKALLMPTDKEVLHNLIRIRFKSKVVNRIFAIALKELFALNSEAMQLLICVLLRNEQTANRSTTSAGIINYCFQHDAEKAVYYLAAIIFDFISSKDDHSRMLKNVLRDIQRSVLKSEFPLAKFCKTLFNEWKAKSEQMQAHKERVCQLMEELFCMAVLLHVPQFTKDLPPNWRKDCSIWIPLHQQIRSSLHEAVLWLKYRCASDSGMCKADVLKSINNMLFLNKPEFYSAKDHGLMDQERSFNYKVICESGLNEETFHEILSSAAAGQLPLSGLETFEIVEAIVHRSCASPFNDQVNLQISDGKIIDYILQCCVLRIPHQPGQHMVKLANATFYWRAWIVTIILGALNPKSVGEVLWNCYPIAQCFMHMIITDDFVYPPSVLTCKEIDAEMIRTLENMATVAELEAVVGKEVAESYEQKISFFSGPVRSPPQSTVDLLQRVTKTFCLKNRICLSRSPDFLMDVMNRQEDIQCSTWLVDLVRKNDDPFKYLPVACTCEFFLNDCEDADKLDLTSDANQLLDISSSNSNNNSVSSVSSTGSALDPSCQVSSLRSELKRKRIYLASELKKTIHDDKSDRLMAVQALSYLIGRLKDESDRTRCFTVQAFQELLKEGGGGGGEEEAEDLAKAQAEDRDVSCEPEFFWLFSALPSLPYYRDVVENVTDALFSACLVETDFLRLHAYIAYLHQHVDEQQRTRYCMAMCNFITKRSATFLQLVPVCCEDVNEPLKAATFCKLLELFYNHILQSVNKTTNDVKIEERDQNFVHLYMGDKIFTVHQEFISALQLLLVGIPNFKTELVYEKMFELIFQMHGRNMLTFTVDFFNTLMRSSNHIFIDAVLEKADLNSVISCLLQFGLPIDNVSKLLRKLNSLLASSQNIPHSTVQQLLAMRYIIGAYVENGSVASDQYLRLVHKYSVEDESQQQQLSLENAEIEDEDEPMDVSYADNIALTTWSCEDCLQALFVKLKDDLDYGWMSPLQEAVSVLLADFSPVLLHRCAKWLLGKFSTWKVNAGILKNYNSLQTILIMLLCLETEEEVRMSMSSIVERLGKIPNFGGEEVIRGCRRLLNKEIGKVRRKKSLSESTGSTIEKRKLASSFDRSLISFNPELMSTTIADVIEYAVSSANPSQNQVVLFALLHVTKLSTVVDIVHCMLSDYFESYNPTIILDFVAASYKSLRLPCSQDFRPVRFYERAFHLEADHLLSLAKYILAEFSIHLVPLVSLEEAPAVECVEWLGGSDEISQSQQNLQNVREELSMQSALLEMRMKLLLEACDDDSQLTPVIHWLEIKRTEDDELEELCDLMIMQIYFQRTGSCPISEGGYPLFKHLSELVNWQHNQMDTVLHHLIRRSAALARQSNMFQDELKTVCAMLRRHASFHPELVVRHLPLIAALLRGTTEIDGRSYTETNYLFWFAELLSLLKLLMPQACTKCYVSSLMDIFSSFFKFVKMHVLRNSSLLGYADNMFALLNSFLTERSCFATKYLLTKEPLIRMIAERYPEVVNIQAVDFFVGSVVNFEREIVDDGNANTSTSSPSTSSSTQANPNTTALPADSSRSVSQKSSPLISLVSNSENTVTVQGIKQLFEDAEECFQTDPERISLSLENLSSYMLNVDEEVRKSAIALTLKLAKEYPNKYECILPTVYAALEGENLNALKALLESFGEMSIVFPTQILSRLFGMAFNRLHVDDTLRELFSEFFKHLLLTVNHVSANATAERH